MNLLSNIKESYYNIRESCSNGREAVKFKFNKSTELNEIPEPKNILEKIAYRWGEVIECNRLNYNGEMLKEFN